MKVAMVTSWEEPCGIADFTRALVGELQQHIEVKIIPMTPGIHHPEYYRGLARQCRDCDLAHIQHEYVYFGGIFPWNNQWQHMIRALTVPYVVTVHTWLKPGSGGPLWKRGLRALRNGLLRLGGWPKQVAAGQFRQARKILVHTRAHQEALQQQGLPAERLHVLPQGVPRHLPAGHSRTARAKWKLQGKVVTLFGFLIPSKGHLFALEAWAQAPADTTLVIVGQPFSRRDYPYAARVIRAVSSHPQRVRMTGYLPEPELADVLAASDLVIMPYLDGTSSYSLSILMAYGRAVLCSDIKPFREMHSQRPCVALFRAGDQADFVRQVESLLADSGQRRRLQQEAKAWATAHGWDAIAKQVVAVYREVLA